jgi:hypothetical protein
MIERIRSRYSLQYAAPEGAAGAYHQIHVEVRKPGAVVHARAGYYTK